MAMVCQTVLVVPLIVLTFAGAERMCMWALRQPGGFLLKSIHTSSWRLALALRWNIGEVNHCAFKSNHLFLKKMLRPRLCFHSTSSHHTTAHFVLNSSLQGPKGLDGKFKPNM